MTNRRIVCLLLAVILAACAPAAPAPTPASPLPAATSMAPIATPGTAPSATPPDATRGLTLTIVYDNTVHDPRLAADWGFAALVEYGGHTLLFDTGANGPILLSNLQQLNIDVERIEAVVLSHEHTDHTGGLSALLGTGIRPAVYAPAAFSASFKRWVSAQTSLVEITAAQEIFPGIHVTGPFGTTIVEQALVVETPAGAVMITGCAHPGIVAMVRGAQAAMGGKINVLIGGFHLIETGEEQVRQIIADLRQSGVAQILPTHCTGDAAIAAFQAAYGESYLEGGVGRVVTIGGNHPSGAALPPLSAENTADVAQLRTLQGYRVWSVAFTPDGRRVASGNEDGKVRVWDAGTGELLQTLTGHTGWALGLAISPDGAILASGDASANRSCECAVRLWDLATGQSLRTLSGHTAGVWSVAFSPDGLTLASGSWDGTVRLWQVTSGEALATLKHGGHVLSVAFSPDGRLLASSGTDYTIRIWDASSGALLRTLEGPTGNVGYVAFSPDGRLLASASDDDLIRLWDPASGELLRTLAGHKGWVNGVAFSPDGRLLASGSHDHTVGLWDVGSGRLLRTLEGHTDVVLREAFSPDGRMLASASWDGTVRLWGAGGTNGLLAGGGVR